MTAEARAAYILGAPGVGKSSVMSALYDVLEVWPDPDTWYRERGELHVEPLRDWVGRCKGFSIGRTREAYSGTDALSMSAARDARAWALDCDAEPPELLLAEGARLAEVPFLAALSLKVDKLRVVYLQAAETTMEARRAGRTQSPTFMKGATTRAGTAMTRLKAAGLLTDVIMTDTLTPHQVATAIAEALR